MARSAIDVMRRSTDCVSLDDVGDRLVDDDVVAVAGSGRCVAVACTQ